MYPKVSASFPSLNGCLSRSATQLTHMTPATISRIRREPCTHRHGRSITDNVHIHRLRQRQHLRPNQLHISAQQLRRIESERQYDEGAQSTIRAPRCACNPSISSLPSRADDSICFLGYSSPCYTLNSRTRSWHFSFAVSKQPACMLWSFPEASCDGNDYTIVAEMYPGAGQSAWCMDGRAGAVQIQCL